MQKLRYLYLIFICGFLQFGFSQTKTIDSLKNLLGTSLHDCERADILCEIGVALLDNHKNDLAIRFGKQSLDLATNLSCDSTIIRCYNLLGIAFDDNGDYPNARKFFQLGLDLSIKLDTDQEIVE